MFPYLPSLGQILTDVLQKFIFKFTLINYVIIIRQIQKSRYFVTDTKYFWDLNLDLDLLSSIYYKMHGISIKLYIMYLVILLVCFYRFQKDLWSWPRMKSPSCYTKQSLTLLRNLWMMFLCISKYIEVTGQNWDLTIFFSLDRSGIAVYTGLMSRYAYWNNVIVIIIFLLLTILLRICALHQF